jgi:hypothetical protein
MDKAMSEEIKTRPVFDMNQCKEGDLLESIHGVKLEYVGKNGTATFPHRVKYLYEHFPDNSFGTRTEEGFVYDNKPLPEDHDIKGFWKGQGKKVCLE